MASPPPVRLPTTPPEPWASDTLEPFGIENPISNPEDVNDEANSDSPRASAKDSPPRSPNQHGPASPSQGSETQTSNGIHQKDDVEKPAKKKRFQDLRRKYDTVTCDYWTYEALALLLCVSALASIIAILFAYQGGPTPHIMHGVSLNTAISVLATLSRAAALFVIASIIAQQKWLRFAQQPRSLYEVLVYDDATRGPLGSLVLVVSLRLGLVTMLAAGVAVLAIGFEPFVQQSVTYPLRDRLISGASPNILAVRNATLANAAGQNQTLLIADAVTQNLYADSVSAIQPTCLASSCKWPLYESIAFCSSCEDAMDDVVVKPDHDVALQTYAENGFWSEYQFSDLTLNYNNKYVDLRHSQVTSYTISLGVGAPLQLNVTAAGGVLVAPDTDTPEISRALTYPETNVWDLTPVSAYYKGESCFLDNDNDALSCVYWTNETVNGIRGPLKAWGYVSLNITSDTRGMRLLATSAQRCVITPCVRTYSSTVRNASLVTSVHGTEFGVFDVARAPNKSADSGEKALTWHAFVNGIDFQAGPPDHWEKQHSILDDFLQALSALQGATTRVYDADGDEDGLGTSGIWQPSVDIIQLMTDIRNSTAKIAQGLTNLIQQNGDSHIGGHAYASVPFVHVRWWWLAFPISLATIVLATLIATMVQTRRQHIPTWRASPFPMLFNYHDSGSCTTSDGGAAREAFRPHAVATSKHEEIAKDTQLRLGIVNSSWTFEKTG